MTHPIEVKAVAWAALLAGDKVNHVARRTGVPKQTISRWRQQILQKMRHRYVKLRR